MSAYGMDSTGSFTTLSRHDEYYINGGDLYFLVERVTFRVHSYFFQRESPRFKGQLTIPASPGAQRQGTSDSNAIVIEGVKAAHFAKFLWVFYNPKYSLYKAAVADWVIILELAHKWQFHEVKDLCVRELEKLQMPDVDRVAAYNNFEVDKNLLVPRYAALCERETPLSLHEGLQLGMEVAIRIASAREHARANPAAPSGARSPHPAHLADSEMVTLVRDMFDIPAPADEAANQPTNPVGATTNAQGKAQQSKTAPPPPAPAANNKPAATTTQNQPAKTTTTTPAANGNANSAANGTANPGTSTSTANGSAAPNGEAAKDKDAKDKDAAKDVKDAAKDGKAGTEKKSGAAPEASTKVEDKANNPLKVAVSGVANKPESESTSRPGTPSTPGGKNAKGTPSWSTKRTGK